MVAASRFRVLIADTGLTKPEVGKLLHVTERTVRYWFSGKTEIPYSAFKLLRILRLWELPPPFEGWRIHSGKLWTPEGLPIAPVDGSWWSLLVRQARCFRALYQRSADFERALMMLGAKGLEASDGPRPGSLNVAVAEAAQRGERLAAAAGAASASPGQGTGRRAAPLDLSLGHFGTRTSSRVPGEGPLTSAVAAASEVPK